MDKAALFAMIMEEGAALRRHLATEAITMPLVPSRITAQVREMHIALGHAVMELLEDRPGHA